MDDRSNSLCKFSFKSCIRCTSATFAQDKKYIAQVYSCRMNRNEYN